MGRKSSAKDRAYITQSERKEGYGSVRVGANANSSTSAVVAAAARRAALVSLPYTHCALTCEPWQDPVCTPDGDVVDVIAAVPAIRASGGRNPLTGEALALKDLVRLHYHRVGGGGGGGGGGSSSSSIGSFGCPVTGKAFTSSSHIVAIRTTGNVFSYEAVEKLNLKAKHFRDLVDDTPFAKSDIIHLQDPFDVSGTVALRAEKRAASAKALNGSGAPKAASAADASADNSNNATDGSANIDKGALGKDAQRILARLSESKAAAAALTLGPGGPAAGGRGDRGASRVPGADPRLRAPERERVAAPSFKAGAATWDTTGDDSSQQQLSFQMRKEAERRRKREEAEEEARKLREANKKAASGGEKRAPRPYGDAAFARLAAAAKAAKAAASRPVAFTSSVTPLVSAAAAAAPSTDLLPKPPKFRKPKAEKGYCRLRTNLGDLNLELFASEAPRAAENFVVLAKSGYYDGCVFHRSVRNFCAQSGVSFFFAIKKIRGGGVRRKVRKKTNKTHSFSLSLSLSFSVSLPSKTETKTGPHGHGTRRRIYLRRPIPLRGPRGLLVLFFLRIQQQRQSRSSNSRRKQPPFFFSFFPPFPLPLPRRPRGPRHGQLGRPRL